MKPDYEGFCKEFEERSDKGLPIDRTTMFEMGFKYGTIQPCDEDCYIFRENTCDLAETSYYCHRMFKPTNQYDDAGPRIY